MSSQTQTKPEVENKQRVTVNWPVFIGSALGISAIALWTIIMPQSAGDVLTVVVGWISKWFGSFYIVLATVIVVFVIGLALSRFGKIRLGPPNSRPEFSTFSWASMLFAAGIGTDIMFFSVAEPVAQYMHPPVGDGQTLEAARQSTVWTLFHYGITGWAMYALMGIALGYFAYRRGLPLAVRSALSPIFGDKLKGGLGHAVDGAAVLGTIFGVATTLGIGVVQLNVGLDILFGIEQGIPAQIGLVALAVVVATVSATSGINKGIRILSQLNVILAVFLSAWVLVTGKTDFLLNAIVMNIGDFVAGFPGMTMETFAYSDVSAWMAGWTLFFWAWWVAWASFVGMFLARISRGRTIRQFVAGTMTIPFLYILMWISIFGNSAIDYIRNEGAIDFAEKTVEIPEYGFYTLLQEFPAAVLLVAIATFVGLLFYVTSADSGALVMANLSAHLPSVHDDAPAWMRIFWAAVTGILTIGVLLVGGIPALQNATIVMGLPFSFVMILVMLGLIKALNEDDRTQKSRERSMRNIITGAGSVGELANASWRDRLARTFDQVTPAQASRYLDRVAEPALKAVAEELRKQGYSADVIRGGDEAIEDVMESVPILDRLKFVAGEGNEQFIYRILAIDALTPVYGGRMSKSSDTSTRLEVHLPEGGQDYDVMGYSADALIHDVLDQFDRHQDYWRVKEEVLDN
ncbi:MAG: choline BCCT transporter BetT [Actinomycetaceae bacterium]|nr:choline BCCT transporter BetT [Actinomycetaceae bacterium]